MLYDENFIISKQDKISDDMGGFTLSEPIEIGSFKATTIPLSMDFQLTNSAKDITEVRRLFTDSKLPIDFQTTKEMFTLTEKDTERDYDITEVFSVGFETSLLIRRVNS